MLEKTQIDPYRRRQQKHNNGHAGAPLKNGVPPRDRLKVIGTIAQQMVGQLMFLVMAFFVGHGVLLGELNPFGPALVAAGFIVYRHYAAAVFVGVVLGSQTGVSGWELAINMVTLVLVGLAALSLPLRSAYFRLLMGGVVFALMVLVGTVYVTACGATTYDYMKVLFEAVFGAFLAVAFYNGLKGIKQIARGQQVAPEIIFYLVLLLVSIVAGAGQLSWWGVSPGGVLADLVVLLAAYIGRAGLGAAAGAVLGILPGLIFSVTPATLGVLAFAGFLAGLMRFLNRFGVVLGFMLGQILLTVYLGLGQDVATTFIESTAAGLIFLILPRSLLMYFYKNMSLSAAPTGSAVNGGDTLSTAGAMARDWHRALAAVADVADQARPAAVQRQSPVRDKAMVIGELKSMVCAGCVLYRACWERDETRTKKYMDCLFDIAVAKGEVNAEDMTLPLQRCSRRQELLLGINCLQQLHRMQNFWENKLRQSQSLVLDQFNGLQQVMQAAHQKMLLTHQHGAGREEALKSALKQAGFKVADINLYPSGGDFELQVTMPTCHQVGVCRYDLAPFLTSLTGFPLRLGVLNCVCGQQDDFCGVRYYPDLLFSLKLGLAWSSGQADHATGDGYLILPLTRGRIALALSDGIGTGAGAAAMSKTLLTLLQKMLEIGLEPLLAARMLNVILMQQWTEDNYATLDLCIIDLVGGRAEIVKAGAAPGFHLSQNKVQEIIADALPVGVVGDGGVFTAQNSVAAGDMLIMVTDGVTDIYGLRGNRPGPDWVTGLLEEINDLPPQEVADLILKLAQSSAKSHGGRADDMTVLVAQVTAPDPAE